MLMSFRRNRLRPVNSLKHVIDIQGGLVAGSRQNFNLVQTVDAPILANVAECETASVVNSVYLKVECYATSTGALANCYMIIMKNGGGNLATPNGNAVGVSDNKKFVIHQEMVMLEKNTTGLPRILFKGVIRIPRGYRRNGTNDLLQISMFSPGITVDFCIECIYKELR